MTRGRKGTSCQRQGGDTAADSKAGFGCGTDLQVLVGVPVRVVDDDGVCGRQVDAEAPGPRGQQEHLKEKAQEGPNTLVISNAKPTDLLPSDFSLLCLPSFPSRTLPPLISSPLPPLLYSHHPTLPVSPYASLTFMLGSLLNWWMLCLRSSHLIEPSRRAARIPASSR